MNIIFDLDGTLINSKPRLYKLFQHLVPSSAISFNEYWNLKKNKTSHQEILANNFSYNDFEISQFLTQWMHLIESPEFLKFDEEIFGVKKTLSVLHKKADLHVCTARQFREPVLEQLERFGLSAYISKVLVTMQKTSKSELVTRNITNLDKNDWVVGDTGNDIELAKELEIQSCAVLSGFLSEKCLLEYMPSMIVESVNQFDPCFERIQREGVK